MKIDVFTHIMPAGYLQRIGQGTTHDPGMSKRVANIAALHDLQTRLRMVEQFGDYQQILSLASPPIEVLAGPDRSAEIARSANDAMAEICAKHRDHFPSFVASLPMNNPAEAVKEIDRAITKLNACAVQIFTHVAGHPLVEPPYFPIFERAAHHDRVIFMHPARSAKFADYPTESESKYELWWALGWPYETSVAMARMVYAGFFDKLPNLKILTHHLGGMIPYFEGRVGAGLDQIGTRTPGQDHQALVGGLKRRAFDYYKMFYADTALFGSLPATRCGLAFFGVDHCLFASDSPFDPEGGTMFIRETIRVLDALEISAADRQKLYEGNARRLLKL